MKIDEYTAYDLDMTKALASFISIALKNSEKSEKPNKNNRKYKIYINRQWNSRGYGRGKPWQMAL